MTMLKTLSAIAVVSMAAVITAPAFAAVPHSSGYTGDPSENMREPRQEQQADSCRYVLSAPGHYSQREVAYCRALIRHQS